MGRDWGGLYKQKKRGRGERYENGNHLTDYCEMVVESYSLLSIGYILSLCMEHTASFEKQKYIC